MEAKCVEIWDNELRKEYSWMNDSVFKTVYDKAYEDSHAFGYDSMADEMADLSAFVQKILEAQ